MANILICLLCKCAEWWESEMQKLFLHISNALFVWCLGASFILCYLSVPQVNVVTEAAIKDSCHSSWIFEACLYSNPFVLLSAAAKLPSLPHGKSLLIPLSNHRLWTASVWTRSRPTLATPITPVAPGDQTGMGMFPVCRQPFHLTVYFSAVSV